MSDSAPTLLTDVIWDDYPGNAAVRALLIFEQADHPGMTVLANAMSDGAIHGVRDVGPIKGEAVLDVWIREARTKGWAVIDMRSYSGPSN